ncbi:SAM-dependent methyltransferase [Streptomyces sp. NBC_00237]|uniref:SAM-dependent methyltransferase n=1 Tax=Streptomyces sp. NBC_00237 TaxID=2975687 RepID=UPI002251D9AF|nr:SAM-dependent methyltransferase [Streptomyces sp. NBC_00237]MCX5203521.1 SAM-dependent methyltransferase [Streptomyces sp. NBC_00237]
MPDVPHAMDLLVVLRAEDAVLDFLSVTRGSASVDQEAGEHSGRAAPGSAGGSAPGGAEGSPGGAVRVLCCDVRQWIDLAPGTSLADRLAALAPHVRSPDARNDPPDTEELSRLLREAAGGRAARVWTHSPADNRRGRGRIGRDVAAGDHGLPVRHAVGYSPYLQFVSDEDRPLDRDLIAAKLDFVNRHCAPLLSTDSPEFMIYTARVPAAERFFTTAGAREREGLFALLASLDDEAATVADPWEFETSPYERARLDATTAWVARHRAPDEGPLVEVGACEGALTVRLAAKGYPVDATEPNPLFRDRLARHLETGFDGVRVHEDALEGLAAVPRLPGSAYLLIEMLYYGQDLDLLDALPTDLVLLALEPAALAERVRPWLAGTSRWALADETVLVAPALEPVCGGRAYLSKRGSTGLVLRRTGARG